MNKRGNKKKDKNYGRKIKKTEKFEKKLKVKGVK
jgi:hypothetical protein